MVAALAEDRKFSTLERSFAATGIAAFSVGATVVWYFNPSNVNFLPVCPLYSLTGLACPGCGLTRGFHALFHGDLWTALDYNALIPLFAALFGMFFIAMVLVAAKGRGVPRWFFLPKPMFGFLVLLLAFGVLRNLPIYPFSILYP